MLTKENVQDIYGLTPMQEGMLLHYARDSASTDYIEQFDFRLTGAVDAQALQGAIDALLGKYDALRTIFSFRKTDTPRQVVLRRRQAALRREDFSQHEAAAAEAAVERYKLLDRAAGFDLSADVLVRFALLTDGPQRHRLLLTFHHIILDGWCMGTLLGDLFGYYERLRAAPGLAIDEREAYPYRHYIGWLGAQDKDKAREYWSQALAGYQAPAGAPYFDVPHEGGTRHAEHGFTLGSRLTGRLAALARQQHVTFNCLFQAAWGILLQKYNNTDDVVFGAVVSGRPPALAGVEQMVGLFINTQPLRVACRPDESFAAVVERVQAALFEASAYDYYPLASIQSASPLKHQLLNHVVTFENFPLAEHIRAIGGADGLQVGEVQVFQAAKYDFHVVVHPGEDLRIQFVYNAERYAEATIAGMARSLVHLLEQAAGMPAAAVKDLVLCAPEDARRILGAWNATERAYPRERSVAQLFIEQAAATPEAPAVRDGARRFSYAELHARALAAAAMLRAAGVNPGDTVGLLAPRCAEMVIGMLGAFYCGAAYIPVEAGTSAERVRFMLEDGDARLLCTMERLRHLAPEGVAVHLLDAALPDADAPPAAAFAPQPARADGAAYLMYTSGSTGQPKGCSIAHRSIVRLVKNTASADYVDFGPQHRILQTGSPAFDASTFEIWGALLNGGELCLVDEATILDPALLRAALRDQRITVLWLTSALFNQLCEADAAMFAPLHYLLVGGDVLSPRHIELARAANPQLRLINGYGPTENTTFSTTFAIERAYPHGIPIGRPIANSSAYILDATGQLLPPGALGELCVGGDGVGLGYVKRPDLTAEKFVADPFRPGGRLYRTGDLARWLPNGSIGLLGRTDFQVKIRGFRVELGEVERALCGLAGVQEAVVLAHDGAGGKQLHAFWTGPQGDAQQLRTQLAAALPAYMVPAFWLRVERMPLTVNGKVDRRALPVEQGVAARGSAPLVQPASVTERRIAGICKEVLGIDEIGLHENFFDVGATSLNLIAINNRLKDAFGQEIPLAVLFEYTSVGRLAQYLGTNEAAQEARRADEQQELQQSRSALLKTRNLLRTMEE